MSLEALTHTRRQAGISIYLSYGTSVCWHARFLYATSPSHSTHLLFHSLYSFHCLSLDNAINLPVCRLCWAIATTLARHIAQSASIYIEHGQGCSTVPNWNLNKLRLFNRKSVKKLASLISPLSLSLLYICMYSYLILAAMSSKEIAKLRSAQRFAA